VGECRAQFAAGIAAVGEFGPSHGSTITAGEGRNTAGWGREIVPKSPGSASAGRFIVCE
jgi:hypothetical protein